MPRQFYRYKVVLDETPPRKMIAFIAPNADTKKKPWQLTATVDAKHHSPRPPRQNYCT